jgi:hypothetical protein
MRRSVLALGVSFVGLVGLVGMGVPACSSSSSGSPTAPNTRDGGGDDGSVGSSDGSVADQTAQSCSGIAACYSAVVKINAGAPATCGTGFTTVADYSSLPANGGPFTLGGCSGQLSGCNMTFTCPDGESWSVAFSGAGFAATISEQNAGACQATVVGTRLATCPAPTDGGAPPDSGDAGPAMDVQVEASVASDASEGGVLAEAGAEAGEGGAAAALDAGEDVTPTDAGDAGVDATEAGDDGPTE